MLPLIVLLLFYIRFIIAVPTTSHPPILRLPSNHTLSIHNSTDHAGINLPDWPPWYHIFEIDSQLSFQIVRYGVDEDPSFEPEFLESIDFIELDIETEGDGDLNSVLDPIFYCWDQVGIILGDMTVKPPATWLTKRQALNIIDFITGLTLLYGPREITSFTIREKATGRLQRGALFFRSRH